MFKFQDQKGEEQFSLWGEVFDEFQDTSCFVALWVGLWGVHVALRVAGVVEIPWRYRGTRDGHLKYTVVI